MFLKIRTLRKNGYLSIHTSNTRKMYVELTMNIGNQKKNSFVLLFTFVSPHLQTKTNSCTLWLYVQNKYTNSVIFQMFCKSTKKKKNTFVKTLTNIRKLPIPMTVTNLTGIQLKVKVVYIVSMSRSWCAKRRIMQFPFEKAVVKITIELIDLLCSL